MVVFARINTANDRQSMHLPGGLWKQFADVSSRNRRWDRTEWPSRRRTRLGVPAFQLAESAVHIEHDHPFLLLS